MANQLSKNEKNAEKRDWHSDSVLSENLATIGNAALKSKKEVHTVDFNKLNHDLSQIPEDQVERFWFENVYQGDHVAQLTVRAVLVGALLGVVLALGHVYVSLKLGWSFGVAITACIVSYALNKLFRGVGLFQTDMTILENNCMQSTASSAGYSTGTILGSAVPALLMITGQHLPPMVLALWLFFIAALGTFLAIPMKRQLVNREQLKFPSGLAAAETLKSLYAQGKESALKARSLLVSGVLGGAIGWLRDAASIIPSDLHFRGSLLGQPLAKWSVTFENSSLLIAAGAIIGWKVSWSMFLGACLNYLVLAPKAVGWGAIDISKLGFRAITSWSVWVGSSMMVSAGLLQFFMQWRTIQRSFQGFAKRKKGQNKLDDAMAAIEVPNSWFLTGAGLSGLGCIILMMYYFGTSWWMGIVAVVMTYFLCLVAARATGESDITPSSAMGKITQLAFGVLAPSNIVTNLMTASVTANAGASAADLLTDLKSGYLLGANPRKQFLAQFLGIFVGVAAVVPTYYILVPNAEALGTDQFPAPAAQVWAAVARLMSTGVSALHSTALWGMLFGGLAGIALVLLNQWAPKKLQPFIPSPTGLGLSFVIPFKNSLSFFVGAVIALGLEKKLPALANRYIVPVSSGFIAGESIVAVAIALMQALG